MRKAFFHIPTTDSLVNWSLPVRHPLRPLFRRVVPSLRLAQEIFPTETLVLVLPSVRSTKPSQNTANITKKPNLPTVMVGGAQPNQPQASSVAPKAPPATRAPNFIPQLPRILRLNYLQVYQML